MGTRTWGLKRKDYKTEITSDPHGKQFHTYASHAAIQRCDTIGRRHEGNWYSIFNDYL